MLVQESTANRQLNQYSGFQGDDSKLQEWGKNDKIFGVVQDQSHKLQNQADNPFQKYEQQDLEPLVIDDGYD